MQKLVWIYKLTEKRQKFLQLSIFIIPHQNKSEFHVVLGGTSDGFEEVKETLRSNLETIPISREKPSLVRNNPCIIHEEELYFNHPWVP